MRRSYSKLAGLRLSRIVVLSAAVTSQFRCFVGKVVSSQDKYFPLIEKLDFVAIAELMVRGSPPEGTSQDEHFRDGLIASSAVLGVLIDDGPLDSAAIEAAEQVKASAEGAMRVIGSRPNGQELLMEDWNDHYALFIERYRSIMEAKRTGTD